MKKLITPIIHSVFLFPLTGIAVGAEMIARSYELLPPYNNMVDAPLVILGLGIIIIVGTPLFWLVNKLMQALEKPSRPTIYDHLRQSFFFYLITIYALLTWIFHSFTGSEEDGYLLLWLGFSLVAIVVNGIFLFRKPKANATTSPSLS